MKVYILEGIWDYSGSKILGVYSSKAKAFKAKDLQDKYCKLYNLESFLLWLKRRNFGAEYPCIDTADVRERLNIPKGRGFNSCHIKEFEVQ